MVEVSSENEQLHRIAEAELDTPRMASAAKPHLYSDSQEIQIGHSPVMGFPNLGPLIVEEIDPVTGQDSYYGIVFNDDARSQLTETWRIEYEGALPGTGSLRALPATSSSLSVPGAELCSLGVLPGDLFVFNVDEGNGCEAFAEGGTFNYVISEVGRDWIELESGSGWRLDEEEQLQELEDPDPACFPLPLRFTIRPPGVFVIRGSKTGYLHNVEATSEGCREMEGGDPLFSGRAVAASLLPDKTLLTCPVTSAGSELELHTFNNPAFAVNLFPACTLNDEGAVEMVETKRGTLWTFAASSAFVSQVILSAALPVDAQLHEPENRLYLLDLAGKSLKAIDLKQFSLTKSYY